jgi:hypothetical protein
MDCTRHSIGANAIRAYYTPSSDPLPKHALGGRQVHEAVHRGVQRDAIALVDSLGKTVTAVARELRISLESLNGW